MADTETTERAGTVEERARRHFEALGRRDVDTMLGNWSEAGVLDLVPLRVVRGRGEIGDFFRGLFAAVPDLETTVTSVVANEREAAIEWRMRGHFTGSAFEGIDATGRPVEMRGVDRFSYDEDGKIASVSAYWDGMAFARQVGLMPPQDSGAERALKGAFNAVTRVKQAVAERREGTS
jgi:steroid delta-isomerase-like uncharacterized protein